MNPEILYTTTTGGEFDMLGIIAVLIGFGIGELVNAWLG